VWQLPDPGRYLAPPMVTETFRGRLEWRKIREKKMKVSIPRERKATDSFGTKESRNHRETFQRKGNVSCTFGGKEKSTPSQGNFFSNACSHMHVLIKLMLFFITVVHSYKKV